MKHSKRSKPFLQMTPAERERDVSRFDGPIDLERDLKPLTLREQLIDAKLRGEDVRSAMLLHLKPRPRAQLEKLAQREGVTIEAYMTRLIRQATPRKSKRSA